ncbi:MAG: Rid family hydrolase [Desulfobacterales bacterium]|nr:Rid family hydrolase [Desulfobacterales bacterium]
MKLKDHYLPDCSSDAVPLACRAGDFVFFAGGIAAHPKTGVPEELKAIRGYPYHWSNINRQINYIYTQMTTVLANAGSSIEQVMKINTYQTDPKDIYEALRLRKDYFGTETPPPSTLVLVPELPVRGASVITDVIALASDSRLTRQAAFTSTTRAPMPPHQRIWNNRIYIKAARGGGFIFTSGRTNNVIGAPTDDKSLEMVDFPYYYDKPKIATEIILDYLKSVLEEEGATFNDVVKAEIHVNDMSNIAGLDEVWQKAFPKDPPARIFVPVTFPNEYAIFEIELIAVDPKSPYKKETVFTNDAPEPLGHEPQAVKAGNFLFFSGQLATDYKNGIAPSAQSDINFPFHSSAVKKQVKYILDNVDAICRAAGTSKDQLVRRRAIHENLNEFGQAESVWREVLGNRLPPTTTFQTAGPLPVPGCTIQYDLIAFLPENLI